MSIPPDWYLDPTNRHERRYWDGSRWTDQVRDGSSTGTDPLDPNPQVQLEPLAVDASSVSVASTADTTGPEDSARQQVDDGDGDPIASAVAVSAGPDEGPDADEPRPWAGSAEGGYDAFARSAGLTAADTRPRYAHAMARGALLLALLSLFASLTVVLGLVGLVGGLVALVVGLRARQRLIDLGDTDQTVAVRAVLLGVLAAMVGTLGIVLLAALWVDGEVIRFVACTEQATVGDCVGDLAREARARLTP